MIRRGLALWLVLVSTLVGASDAQAAKRLVFKASEADIIEGEAQKPEVTVFISKENLNEEYQLELKQSFLTNIVEAAKHAPF